MAHRFPFPSGRHVLLHITLVSLLIFSSHCKQQDDTPPPPKAARAHTSANCCRLTATTGLKEGVGRFVVAFPNGAVPKTPVWTC